MATKIAGRLANAPVGYFTQRAKEVLKISAANAFVDGNLSHTHYLKPKDKIVGQDVHGNLYMEDYTSQYGRHRWVVYSNHDDYADGPTSIPPEWHGWLHYIHDQRADDFSKEYKPPIYQAAPTPTKSGYSDQNYYVPKGHWRHPGVATKSWKKYSAWKP